MMESNYRDRQQSCKVCAAVYMGGRIVGILGSLGEMLLMRNKLSILIYAPYQNRFVLIPPVLAHTQRAGGCGG